LNTQALVILYELF